MGRRVGGNGIERGGEKELEKKRRAWRKEKRDKEKGRQKLKRDGGWEGRGPKGEENRREGKGEGEGGRGGRGQGGRKMEEGLHGPRQQIPKDATDPIY